MADILMYLRPDKNCKLVIRSGELMEMTPNSFTFSTKHPAPPHIKNGYVMINCKTNDVSNDIFKMLLTKKQAIELKNALNKRIMEIEDD